MARMKRVVLPGIPLHITHRGNNRSNIFQDDEDRHEAVDVLQRAHTKHGCPIHNFVLMSNHIHLLVTPETVDGPAQFMHDFASTYARHFNKRYGRTGALWGGRYHSSLVQTSRYFLACARYIELNPVRALMADHPASHIWSSYHYNANGKKDDLITPHELYINLARNDNDRRVAYRALFAVSLEPDVDNAIRRGIQRCGITGEPSYRDDLKTMLDRVLPGEKHGGDRRSKQFQQTASISLQPAE